MKTIYTHVPAGHPFHAAAVNTLLMYVSWVLEEDTMNRAKHYSGSRIMAAVVREANEALRDTFSANPARSDMIRAIRDAAKSAEDIGYEAARVKLLAVLALLDIQVREKVEP